jgi:hypothetical protein
VTDRRPLPLHVGPVKVIGINGSRGRRIGAGRTVACGVDLLSEPTA